MRFLEYYIHINIYILFFWMFFRAFLRKESFFQGMRFYLIATVFVSLLLPFLHNISDATYYVYEQIPFKLSFSDYITASNTNSVISSTKTSIIDWELIVIYLIAAGSFIMLLIILVKHIKISSLIKKSARVEYGDLQIAISSKLVIPFLYNRSIVIPKSISKKEQAIIIEHEYQHYKLRHFGDNILFQFFKIIFWANPIIYLLQRDLKQIHEYQVDNKLIKSGIDAYTYKLTLIKFSIGFQKFAIANGFSNYKIKNRIIMMNNIKVIKWKWKFLLLIPALSVVFLVLSFTNIDNELNINNVKESSSQIDSKDAVKIELMNISYVELKKSNDEDLIKVMINSNSIMLCNGQKSSFSDITTKVCNVFQERAAKDLTNAIAENRSFGTKIVVQKSSHTNMDDYNKLLDRLSASISKLQEIYSSEIYGKSYHQLLSAEKNKIDYLIQPRLYVLPDVNI